MGKPVQQNQRRTVTSQLVAHPKTVYLCAEHLIRFSSHDRRDSASARRPDEVVVRTFAGIPYLVPKCSCSSNRSAEGRITTPISPGLASLDACPFQWSPTVLRQLHPDHPWVWHLESTG